MVLIWLTEFMVLLGPLDRHDRRPCSHSRVKAGAWPAWSPRQLFEGSTCLNLDPRELEGVVCQHAAGAAEQASFR